MKELLEPIYLNEKMLLNCASYLFDGIGLTQEINNTSTENTNKNLKASGAVESSSFIDFIAKAGGNIDANYESQINSNYAFNTIKTLTLGALHMKSLDKLVEDKLIEDLQINTEIISNIPFKRITANIRPVDFFELIQLLKAITPQLKPLFNIGNAQNQTNNKKPINQKTQVNNFNDIVELLNNVIDELEKNYLESNLLEMLMYQDGRCIGVVDIDLQGNEPNQVKAQLNDGDFIIIGKITKTIKENEELNLLQRSLINPLLTLLEKITVITTLLQQQKESQVFNTNINQILNIKELAMNMIDLVLQIKISGPAVRFRAMSICI
ncbi:DUF6414 family protein [Acinetobacter variabilis]|uniref:DUF6414 family protein n=1 Tax=Acinetobacter variabilis TaxID=70346 RepID=UPI0028AA5F17|nr:hypothetical protein [Acinetobacter variabilis]